MKRVMIVDENRGTSDTFIYKIRQPQNSPFRCKPGFQAAAFAAAKNNLIPYSKKRYLSSRRLPIISTPSVSCHAGHCRHAVVQLGPMFTRLAFRGCPVVLSFICRLFVEIRSSLYNSQVLSLTCRRRVHRRAPLLTTRRYGAGG